jgi:hypothetical protein
VTCILPPLLFSDRVEGSVLETPHFRLQEPQVHEGRPSVIVPHGLLDIRAADREDRDAAAVRATDLDPLELAATHETEGPEEEVVCLEHACLPVDCGRRGGYANAGRGEPVSLL